LLEAGTALIKRAAVRRSCNGAHAMPLPIVLLAIFSAMLLSDIQAASAQSAYSYPWCSVRGRSGAMSCYFTSREQCWATLSGIGG